MPVSWPATANRRWPSASISAARSAARVPVSYPSAGLPDSPVPRWSGTTTENSRASEGITSRHAYQVCGQPCSSSSGGPSPPVTTCWRRSPVSTYRLVNTSVNPSGRFGAPETEPGPSGAVTADELMSIPFPGTLRAFAAQRRTDNPPRDLVAADNSDPTRADTWTVTCGSRLGQGRTHRQHLSAWYRWQQAGHASTATTASRAASSKGDS